MTKAATAARPTAVAVDVPKQRKGGRGSTIPSEFVVECLALINDGKAASDGQLYHKKGEDDEKSVYLSRALANSSMMKVKKAILNDTDNPYNDPKQIKSRCWEAEEGFKFMWAIMPNPNYGIEESDDEDESAEADES